MSHTFTNHSKFNNNAQQIGLYVRSDAFQQVSNQQQEHSSAGLDTARKCEQMRTKARNSHIENIKKAVRFNWNVQQTLQYLKSIDNKSVESQEIINQAIQDGNLQFLVNLVISANSLIRCAIIGRADHITQLIQNNINRPSSIILLGNLCSLYPQYIVASKNKGLMTKLMDQLLNKKSSPQNLQIYSWTLTQMARQPILLNQNELSQCIPKLYHALCQVFPYKQSTSQLCTHLCRLLSQFSVAIKFSEQFINFLTTLRPHRTIDKSNMYIAIQYQIKQLSFSESTQNRIKLVDYTKWLYFEIQSQIPKSKSNSLYSLLSAIIKKSQIELSQHIVNTQQNQSIITEYKYANQQYYTFLYQLFHKLPSVNQPPLLQILRTSGLIQNLVNDIIDPNIQIGYLCLKIMNTIAKDIVSQGNTQFTQWILGLRLQAQVQEFLQNVGNRHIMEKQGQVLLDLIFTQ